MSSATYGSGLWKTMMGYKTHLLLSHGTLSEVDKVRKDLAVSLSPLVAVTCEEYDAPPTASVNAVLLSTATSASAQSYSGTGLTGALGSGPFTPPRNVTVTTGGVTPTHAPASVTITGLDVNGKPLSETITGTNAGAATYSGVKCFGSIFSVSMPAGTGTDATIEVGIGPVMGLMQTPKLRTGQTVGLVRRELMDGALINPVTGTLTSPSTHPPYGSYVPAAAPNGTHQYAIDSEFDASLLVST